MKKLYLGLLLAALLYCPAQNCLAAPVAKAPAASPSATATDEPVAEALTVGEVKNHVEAKPIQDVESLDPGTVGIVTNSARHREFETYGIHNGGPVLVTVTFADKSTHEYAVTVTGGTTR